MTPTRDFCGILDTLVMARQMHPVHVPASMPCVNATVLITRTVNSTALLDAEILADVYLMMTGGQTDSLGRTNQIRGCRACLGDIKSCSGMESSKGTTEEAAAPGVSGRIDKKSEGRCGVLRIKTEWRNCEGEHDLSTAGVMLNYAVSTGYRCVCLPVDENDHHHSGRIRRATIQ